MKCPDCGLLNLETAQHCDCGYDFESKATEKPYFEGTPGRGSGGWLANLILRTLSVCLLLLGVLAVRNGLRTHHRSAQAIASGEMALAAPWLIAASVVLLLASIRSRRAVKSMIFVGIAMATLGGLPNVLLLWPTDPNDVFAVAFLRELGWITLARPGLVLAVGGAIIVAVKRRPGSKGG